MDQERKGGFGSDVFRIEGSRTSVLWNCGKCKRSIQSNSRNVLVYVRSQSSRGVESVLGYSSVCQPAAKILLVADESSWSERSKSLQQQSTDDGFSP